MLRNSLSSISTPLQSLTQSPITLLVFFPSHHLLLRSKKHIASPLNETDDPPFSPFKKIAAPKPEIPLTTLASSKGKSTAPFHSDLHFDFRYSYSETDTSVRPIGYREPPRFSPFGPGRLDRKWDGVSAPAVREFPSDLEVEEQRSSVLGEPLNEKEIEVLVERYRHSDCSRQINLGFGSLCSYTVQG